MFRRKLNKMIAIVVAAATVATSIMPASVYAAEIEDVVVVEDEVTTEDAETVEEATEEVAEETNDDQETSEEAVEESAEEVKEEASEEEVIEKQDEIVSENAAEAVDYTANGTYNIPAKDLVVGMNWNASFDAETGKITYTQQYDQLFFALPTGIDSKRVTQVAVNAAGSDNCEIALKATDGSGTQISVAYSNTISFANPTEFTYIDFMCNSTTGVEFTIASIDITLTDAPAATVPSVSNEYSFTDLTYAAKQGAEYSINEDGVLTVNFVGQYGQVFFRLPEELDDSIIEEVAWNLAEGSGSSGITAKILTESDFNTTQRNGDVAVAYGQSKATSSSEELGLAARYIAIMTLTECSSDEPVVMSFTGVKIKAKSSTRVIADNIMSGYNGNFESDGWWNDGSWSATNIEYASYTEENAAPDSKCGSKYMKVSDPEATGDDDSSRPTALFNTDTGIRCGNAYEFNFWAKLDSAAEGIENPEINLIIQMHESDSKWDNSVFAQVDYDKDNVLTDEWKLYSGVLTIFDGDESLVLSKIVFQAKDGIAFSVDNFELGKTQVAHVEKNIPNFHEKVAEQGIAMSGVAISSSTLEDELAMELVFKHFNSISCENAMKPEVILGSAPSTPVDSVDDLVLHFEEPDKTCDAVKAHNDATEDDIKMRGHVFIWHSQTPTWFFREGFQSNGAYVSKDEMNQRIDDYIRRVAQHFDTKYPGLIYAWDVVNEQANDGGGIRMGTDWAAVYGGSDEYIIQAFKSADEYLAEDTILFYNDYNECTSTKVTQIVSFLTKIRANISEDRKLGAGMQGHHDMATPTADAIEKAVRAYAEVADVIHVTELDVKSTMGFDGNDLDKEFNNNANRYREIYNVLEKVNAEYDNEKVQCVTIWGTHDKVSWLKTSNSVGGSADGKTPQYPLIFDDYYQAKPAFWAIIDPTGENYTEHALAPSQKSITVFESFGEDPFANAKTYEIKGKDGVEASFAMAYVDENVKVKVNVNAPVPDEESDDVVVVYFDKSTPVVPSKVTANTDNTGYVAEFDIAGPINDGESKLFDIVVKSGSTTIAYNDTTLSQDTTVEYFAKATFKKCIIIPRGTITVDGNVDSAWGYAEETLELAIKSGTPVAEGKAKYLWDDENLYILMDVTDSVIDVTAKDAYQQDSIEIFIDENNEKTGSFQDDDKQYRVSAENVQTFNGTKCVASNIKSAVVETETGYVLEAAIAWTDIKPANGTIVGLDLQINDGQNGSRVGTVNLFDNTGNGYQSTANYGSAVLIGEDTEELNIQYIDDVVYTGKAVKPSVVVRQAGVKLVEGKDYTLTYKNNIKVASKNGDGLKDKFNDKLPTVIVTGKGNFKGQVKGNFSIIPADFANGNFEFTYNYSVYTSAKAFKPAITVKYLNAVVNKSYYTVQYRLYSEEGDSELMDVIPANAAGLYEIVVKAKADSPFTGEYVNRLRVLSKTQKMAAKLTVIMPKSKEYTGSEITFSDKELIVKDGTKVLTAGEDYIVVYHDNTKIGVASISIICDEETYFGSTSRTFNITGKPVSKLRVSLSANSVDYTGEAIENPVSVYDGTVAVSEVADDAQNGYKVDYTNNVMPGTATITITGCGKYTGSVKKTFTIKGTPVSKLRVTLSENSVAYTGAPIDPGVTVKDGTTELELVDDVKTNGYKLEFANNIRPGTATVTVVGCGKYTGSVKKTFTITGFNFATATIDKLEKVPYTGNSYKKPAVVVKYKATTDAMVTFFNNLMPETEIKKGDVVTLDSKFYDVELVKGGTNVGVATYKVTGKDVFTGSKNVTMTIDKIDVNAEGSTVSINSIRAITYDKGNNKPAVTVKFGRKTLKAGTDYTVAYSKNVNATTDAVAKVTFKGNFKGTLSKTFEIKKAVINDNYVTTAKDIVANTKTGAYKSTITVAKPNGSKLAPNSDYDAVGIKYYMNEVTEENLITAANLKDKKASLVGGTKIIAVIAGKNNYEGSVKAEYYLTDAMATSVAVTVKAQTFTGKSIELKAEDITATVKVAGKVQKLTYGKDFTVKYLDDFRTAGVHKIEIVPVKGGDNTVTLGGTKTVSVRINPRDMTWSQDIFYTIQSIVK